MSHRYQTILLFGAPGAGKGTQGKILGQVPGFYHLSCGEVFRTIDTGSELGKTFLEYSGKGLLVPDDLTIKMWQQNMHARTVLNDYKPRADILVLDGIPRNVNLVKALAAAVPALRVVAVPVQFRTVAAALAGGLDAAVTVAHELPAGIRRQALSRGGFTCLFDPRHVRVRRLTEAAYFAHEHVVVSYNGDLRGVVDDMLGKTRTVRCAVASFATIGALIEGTALLATVPELVAAQLRAPHPRLRTAPVPLPLEGSAIELAWPAAADDDPVGQFVRGQIVAIAGRLPRGGAATRR